MRILLTGASGFLGRRLRRELRQKKHEVFCYDITLGYNIMFPDQIENTIINWKPDTIIHLAALADLNIFKEKPEFGYQLNVVGTRNVLNLCQKYNLRLLFASTCCCYGNNNIHPSDETSPLAPTEPYAKSKQESEIEILKVGLPHCCMRLATFYGPEMRGALAPAVLSIKHVKMKLLKFMVMEIKLEHLHMLMILFPVLLQSLNQNLNLQLLMLLLKKLLVLIKWLN